MDRRSAEEIAQTILEAFETETRQFRAISAGAKQRFERADWAAGFEANRTRIDLYDTCVHQTVAKVLGRFPTARTDETLWPQVKLAYIALLYDHKRPELAETFYNSVACRVLDRTYYRNEYIFWRAAVSTEFIESDQPIWRSWYPASVGVAHTFAAIVESFGLQVPFENLRRDLRDLLRALREQFPGRKERYPNFQVQVLSSLFYRNKGAYLVGRIINGNTEIPFAIALRQNEEPGRPRTLSFDTVLLTAEHLAALFSLARAYFMVDMDVPSGFVSFLQKLMPQKSRAELYMAVGHQKHGKTVFYRELHESLKHSTDSFVIAPGERGMVMMVFMLPSIPWVFKVIRDEFPPPKQTSAEEVRAKYVLVKYHDRVGRMADALEYSDVAFPLNRLDPALLAELERACAKTVERDGDRLVIKHLYVERRMTPLDLWLRSADPEAARQGVAEYGRAIRELAAANIFAGDLLLKNFGVTRWGRVVFYDYDEISLLTEVSFRHLPRARSDEDETRDEPWFWVGPRDVFPEEFLSFLFPPGPLREHFVELHGELLDPDWWIAQQEQVRRGAQPDLFPYPEALRFSKRFPRPPELVSASP